MNNTEIYKQEINNIFSNLAKLKELITQDDNKNYIDNLNEYRNDVIEFLKTMENGDKK